MGIKSLLAAGKLKFIAMSAVALVGISGALYYFTAKKASGKEFNPAFNAYVSAYTGGVISRESPIQIKFTSEVVKPEQINVPLESELFEFTPSVKGVTMWIDKNTIQFQPAEPLIPGTSFEANFEIGEVMKMPDDLQEFYFSFQTIQQTMEVNIDGLRIYDIHNLRLEKLNGTLSTADVAENSEVEKTLHATQEGRQLKISWIHNEDRRSHFFSVDSIIRKEKAGKIELTWDGSPISSETKGSTTYDIPALGDFSLISAKPVQSEEQYLELQFSDPLLPQQDLTGLISIKDVPDLRFVIDQNIIKVYPPVRQIGLKTVTISEGILNINSKRFPKTQTLEVNFEEIKPSVRMIGKGVILPSTDGLVFPFEAVSLKSVNVKILKIYENNVNQFFQVNNYDGTYELQRVGKVVLNKNISLQNTNTNDYARWKKYYLDLATLINAEPGAIYQVKLGFRKKDIYYTCGDGNEAQLDAGLVENEDDNVEYEQEESSYWDYSEDYYYSEDYDYKERDNPCSDSYYGDYRSVKRNIFASDLGIIAKIGTSGNMVFVVNDLKTTNPVDGASVEIYDYQQQLIKTEKTNSDGIVVVEMKKRPFFLTVRKDKQIGYLKLDNQSALPISNFDVSGAKVQKGIKGFLYGERGVWRPGDSLFLTFILEDKLKNLPDDQPVSFELLNPMGIVSKRIVTSENVYGFYNFSTCTATDDPTGNWTARVKVGGADFTYPIRIETVMPNRLKIKIDFGEKISAGDNQISGALDVKWLHGAIAKNLDADISMQLLNAETKFSKYPDFTFDDPGKTFNSENIEIFNGKIDGNGHADIESKIEAQKNAPGMLLANFKVKVTEEGGAFSVDRFALPYYPYESFVGIKTPKGDKSRNMLLTDTNHVVDIVSVDPDGKPLSGRKIEIQIYKASWRWWWDRSDEDLHAYLENHYVEPIQTGNVTTVNGKAKWQFRINYPDWGRYYIRAVDKESSHSTGKTVYIDWPGWAGKSRERNQGGATILAFTADKEKYNVGENVNISIPGSANGRALVSVESGSKVLQTYWVETKEGQTPFSFSATKEMAPNVYINVTLLQPHAQTKNDLPIRMYGVVPVRVEDPQTILKPAISMKDELRPEENVTISVSEAQGKAMNYTIAVVDEGLLDLTRFKTPDPWNHFYAKEALGVNSWDMYDYVIGAFAEKMDKLLSIGGDGEMKGSEKNKANRFKPVVIFLGPYRLNAGKNATHTFKMPQYVGSVRTMVIAGDPEGAYGNTEKTTPVRKPLMLLATLPRVVGPDEFVALPVNVFAMTNNVRNVNVQIKTNNMFEIMETAQKSVSFAQPGDEVVNFYLKVKPNTGVGKVSVFASSGNEKANYDIEINVRNPNQPQTRVIETVIEAGKEWRPDYSPFGVVNTNSGILEVSTIPPVNLGERLKYLIEYPYGCIEQTTSSVFPQLYLKEFVQNEAVSSRAEQNIKAGIERLKTFQLPEGGLSYWPGYSEMANYWGTNYAGHFMLEAEKKGYSIPNGFLSQWKKYQKKTAKNWTGQREYYGPYGEYYYSSPLDQAYRLYTLALAGEPETGAMNRLREQSDLPVAAKWRLAAAYHLAGQTDVAKNLIAGATVNVGKYREMSYTFGSEIRDKAMILETMCIMGMRSQAAPLAIEISKALSANSWLSTQEIAYSLLAMSKFASTAALGAKVNFTYSLNGGKAINAVTDMKIAQVDMKVGNSAGNVYVKNNSAGILYARVILTGTPATGTEIAVENNLKMKVEYKLKNGEAFDITKIEQGTDFMVDIAVTNPSTRGTYQNLSIKQIFPSGWEIHNTRMDNTVEIVRTERRNNENEYNEDEEGEGDYSEEETSTETVNTEFETTEDKLSIPTYRDIRDDRVYTFFDLRPGQTKTFRVMLNAAYLGKFYLPGVYAEAMYDGSINAVVPGKWVEVVQSGADEASNK